jgi:hypothetical protein
VGIPAGYGQILGESTRPMQPDYLQVFAEIGMPRATEAAGPTANSRPDNDTITNLRLGYALSHPCHNTHHFVAWYERVGKIKDVDLVQVQIRGTDTTPSDLDQCLPMAHLGLRYLVDTNRGTAIKNHCLHYRLPSAGKRTT